MTVNTCGIDSADGIVFDCDGVLVDVTDSYNIAIIQTVAHVLEWLGYHDMPPATPSMIQAFKDSGGFNNEIDLAYAVILAMAAGRLSSVDPARMVAEVSGGPDVRGVEESLLAIADISGIVDRLAYPGPNSIVQRVFDQLFYGPELYRMVSGAPSEFSEPGLIENETVLLDDMLEAALQERFGHSMALVTGRGYDSARHTLGRRMVMFDREASAFLEDRPRRMAKPNPESLEAAIDVMGVKCCIYVGDSAEDMMMAHMAGRRIVFVGICGTAPDPRARRSLFEAAGVEHIIQGIDELPKLLNSRRDVS